MAFGAAVQGPVHSSNGSVALSSNVSVGNLLVCCFRSGANETPTLSDSLGNTWTKAHASGLSGGINVHMYSATVTIAGACTVTISGATSPTNTLLTEYAGPFSNAPADSKNASIGTSATPSSGNITSSRTQSLFVGYQISGGSVVEGGGWTVDRGSSEDGAICWFHHIVANSGVTDASDTATGGGATNYWAVAVSFLPEVKLSAAAGSYALTGVDPRLLATRYIPATAGVYDIGGVSASLQTEPHQPTYHMTTASSVYSFDPTIYPVD